MPEHTEQPRWALFLERPLSPAEYAALGDYDRRHVYAVGEARLIPAEEAGAAPLGLYRMRPVTEQFGRAVREDASCGGCLRAVHLALGLHNVHHYRHQSDTTGCAASSAESALHLNAKFALAEALRSVGTEPDDVRLRFRCTDYGRPAPSPCEAERIQPWGLLWDDVQVEYRADPVRPDIALLWGGTPVAAVEVLVTHAVDGVKAARLAELGLRWIEVRAKAVYEDWGRPWQPWAPLEAERTDGTYPDAWRCEPHRQLREQERMRELNAPRVAAVRAVRVHRRPDALDQGNLFRVHLVEERQDGEVRSIRLDAQRGSRGHALTRAVPLARGADPVAAADEVYDAWARSETERAQAPVESPMAWVAPSALPRELDGARFPTLLRWDPDLRRHVAPPDHPGVTWPLPATARQVFAPGQPQAWTTNVAMRGLQANALFGRTWLTACREDERRMAHAVWWYNGSDWEEIASGRGMPLPAGFSDADVPALAERMLAALQAGLAADTAERIGQWQAARYVRSALEPIARREESRVQAALADQRAELAAYVSHALPDAITNLGYTLEAGDPAHGQPDLILRSRSGPGDYAVGLCFTQATAAWNPRLHAPQHRHFTYWICIESDYRLRVAGVETDPEREDRIPPGLLIPARPEGGSWEVALGGERTDALLRHKAPRFRRRALRGQERRAGGLHAEVVHALPEPSAGRHTRSCAGNADAGHARARQPCPPSSAKPRGACRRGPVPQPVVRGGWEPVGGCRSRHEWRRVHRYSAHIAYPRLPQHERFETTALGGA